jgi:general nucleoside transport system permease protein
MTRGSIAPPGKLPGWLGSLTVPLLSVLIALIVAGVILIITGANPLEVYSALVQGAFTRRGALGNTLLVTTPYVLLGLGVSLSFMAGLFNIGAEGQFYMGALVGVFVGYALPPGLPMIVHLPLALGAGALAGAVWGGIPGLLKATRGAHEVITTIMFNYIAFALTDFMVNGPMRGTGTAPRTPDIQAGAQLPLIFGAPDKLHWGFVLALVVIVGYWFLTTKMPLGFKIRTVGANPDAARYAGISVPRTTVTTMAISGALCGLAGAIEVLGVYGYMPAAFTTGYGFDSIAIALLGQGGPIGVFLAALLFGAMNSGSSYMQFAANVSNSVISVVQAFIVIFVGAPAIIRSLLNRFGKSRASTGA